MPVSARQIMDSEDAEAVTERTCTEPWRRCTAQFIPRAISMGTTTFEFLHDHLDVLPRAPLSVQLSHSAALKYQVTLLVIGALRTAREIAICSSKLWLQGHFLLASVGIRMLIELNGQLIWADEKVLLPLAGDVVQTASERMAKLLLGARSSIPLVHGEAGPRPFVNVMEFVRAVEVTRPGALGDYEFLCDCAHPCYMMQGWMLFAGPDHDNWTNATFAAQVAPMLDRMLCIAEVALASLEEVADRIMTAVIPAIVAEVC